MSVKNTNQYPNTIEDNIGYKDDFKSQKHPDYSEHFNSRLGFILISAGCAIGLGNVWRFPYIVGKNGGAIFVLIYLVFLVILGLPIMTTEFAVGRASQRTSIKSFNVLQHKPKQKWPVIGYAAMVGCYLLLSYYTMIAGWMLNYVASFAAGDFWKSSISSEELFSQLLADPTRMFIWTFIVLFITALICRLGFKKGVESVTKAMMSLLFVILILLAIRSLSLPNAVQGLKFYLVPNWSNVQKVGLANVIFDAMMQAFFTLSLGVGAMAIFGSRIGKDHRLFGESLNIGLLDTVVAMLSGLIIFPATAAFNIQTGEGPGLIFVTLPKVFVAMKGGRLFGVFFFVFMSFAALSTLIAVFENILSCFRDIFPISRRASIWINFAIILALNLPNIWSFNILSHIQPLGANSNLMDLSDFLVSSNFLPLGSVGYLLFCMSKRGWGHENFYNEVNQGKGVRLQHWTRAYMTYVLPAIVLFIWAMGYVSLFRK